MPTVVLAPALARWLAAHPQGPSEAYSETVTASTVREALDEVFTRHPAIRSYVVDERGALRHHVVVYLDGEAVADKESLATPIRPNSELYIFQALSGG